MQFETDKYVQYKYIIYSKKRNIYKNVQYKIKDKNINL